MKRILLFILVAACAFGQLPKGGGGAGGAGGGQAAYQAPFTGSTGFTVLQTTHLRGTSIWGVCYDNGTPALLIAQTATFPTVNASGDITFAWTGSKTGTCLITSLGSGTPGTTGATGAASTIPGPPGFSGPANQYTAFTSTGASNTVAIPGLGTQAIILSLYDTVGNWIPAANTFNVNPTPPYNITLTFTSPTSGWYVINQAGGGFVFPCVIDNLGNVTGCNSLVTQAGISTGGGTPYTGYVRIGGFTSGAQGFTVPDVAGAANLYVVPPPNPGGVLVDTGTTACSGNLPAGAPGACEGLAFQAPAIACVGTPGNTTGLYRSQCWTGAALYTCNNAAGCALAADWVAVGTSSFNPAAPGTIGGTTPAAGHFTTLDATGGITAISDGVHAGIDALVGNTTPPAIAANIFGFLGPPAASFTSYVFQPSSAAPAANTVFLAGAPVSNIAPLSFGKVTSAYVDNSIALSNGIGTMSLRAPTPIDDTAHGASTTIAPIWINQTTGDTFQLLSATTGAASWARLAPNYGLPLDLAATNISAAYSLFKLRNAYAGNAVLIERSSDSTTQALGFVSGYVDLATAAAFCAGTSCYVATWYDQSGNGRDATQATLAQMPYFAYNTLGSKASISFTTQASGNTVSTILKYLSLPSGVSITNPNFGVVAVAQPRQQYAGAYLVNFGTANGSEISVGTSTQCSSPSPVVNPPVPMVGFSDQFGVHCGGSYSESGPAVFGIFQNATNVQTWVNENNSNTTKTTSTGGPYTGGFIGFESSFSVPYYGDMSTVMLYTTAVTGATRTNLFNSLYRLHGISPQYAMNTWEVDGDSLAGGFGAIDDNGWVSLAGKQLNTRIMNTGTGGITCATLDTQYAANIAPIFPAYGRNKIYMLFCGVNDLNIGGASAATTWGHIQSILTKAAATGWTVVATTMLPCNGIGSCTNAKSDAVNASIRSGAIAAGATSICDFASDPNMGQDSQNSSTTYYLTDSIHPNDLGNAVLAQYALTCVQPLLNR